MENTVHNKRDTRHITAILKQRQQEEHNRHLRHKANRCAKAADNAVNHQRYLPFGSTGIFHSFLYGRHNHFAEQHVIGPVGNIRADCSNGNVINKEHYGCKNRQSQNAVRNNLVNLIGSSHTYFNFFNTISH